MLVKLCAYRIKIFQLGRWIISHGYYLMIFHSQEFQIVRLIFVGSV